MSASSSTDPGAPAPQRTKPSEWARDARAGSLLPRRIGVRLAEQVGTRGVLAPTTRDHFAPLAAGDASARHSYRLAGLELHLELRRDGRALTIDWTVHNPGPEPVQVESAVLGVSWEGVATESLRFLRNGWQSWSYCGVRELDEVGTPEFPSGEWLRGMHHAVGRPPADREGWWESDVVTVVGASSRGPTCLLGVLESGEGFGSVYLRREAGALRIEAEVRLEVPLSPGETRRIESLRIALGDDPQRLLDRFATLWGRRAGARTQGRFQAGWCSWYHFFHGVTEEDLLRNLDALTKSREDLPIELVQLDDGYQRAIGDWLETNEKFPRGLAPIAAEIRSAGFKAGIWTAPFCVVEESRIYENQRQREWLLRNGDELFNALLHMEWTSHARVYALDTTQGEVIAHLEDVFRQLVEMGFDYLKLDFLHSVAMRADARDPGVTRAARLREGLAAVRRGAGEDAFLLGCGSPLGPAVGIVDAMRIGPDVAPNWELDVPHVIPGLEPALPSTKSALRSVLHRAWMHRRLWLNDPDCLMARTEDTALSADEIRSLAAAIAVTGGSAVISDDMTSVDERGRAWIRDTLALAREVDGAADSQGVRILGVLDPGGVTGAVAPLSTDALAAAFNFGDEPRVRELPRAELAVTEVSGNPEPSLDSVPAKLSETALTVKLSPHESGLYRIPDARSLAVFCDFDGTFSVQDVGATIAIDHVGDLRPALWQRYERGELTAWDYNMELLEGLELPEPDLEQFLRTIELDRGAAELVAWCEAERVPFRILSDGFDYNLDRLQTLNDVRFAYDANQLRYEAGRWRLAPGAPDPLCGCGTGICKRGRIEAHRAAHPGTCCVHIGDGRVSDLCGADAADQVFAKSSLADELDQRGVAYTRFETLRDVVGELDRRFGRGAPTPDGVR